MGMEFILSETGNCECIPENCECSEGVVSCEAEAEDGRLTCGATLPVGGRRMCVESGCCVIRVGSGQDTGGGGKALVCECVSPN